MHHTNDWSESPSGTPVQSGHGTEKVAWPEDAVVSKLFYIRNRGAFLVIAYRRRDSELMEDPKSE